MDGGQRLFPQGQSLRKCPAHVSTAALHLHSNWNIRPALICNSKLRRPRLERRLHPLRILRCAAQPLRTLPHGKRKNGMRTARGRNCAPQSLRIGGLRAVAPARRGMTMCCADDSRASRSSTGALARGRRGDLSTAWGLAWRVVHVGVVIVISLESGRAGCNPGSDVAGEPFRAVPGGTTRVVYYEASCLVVDVSPKSCHTA
jgi:hypothetical protein